MSERMWRGWVYQDRVGQTRFPVSWFAMIANGPPGVATEARDLGYFATREEAFAAVGAALTGERP